MDDDNVPVLPRDSNYFKLKPNVRPRFPLGNVVATPPALATLERNSLEPAKLLDRHLHGDFGDLDDHDRSANEAALKNGGRIFSAYTLADGDRLYVITEAVGDDGVSRSSTCILTPQCY